MWNLDQQFIASSALPRSLLKGSNPCVKICQRGGNAASALLFLTILVRLHVVLSENKAELCTSEAQRGARYQAGLSSKDSTPGRAESKRETPKQYQLLRVEGLIKIYI